jgi:hypothetical protein
MSISKIEKILTNGVRVHGLEFVKPGDSVESLREIGSIEKGTRLTVAQLIVDRAEEGEGYRKRLEFEGVPGDFNPQRFKKIKSENTMPSDPS